MKTKAQSKSDRACGSWSLVPNVTTELLDTPGLGVMQGHQNP